MSDSISDGICSGFGQLKLPTTYSWCSDMLYKFIKYYYFLDLFSQFEPHKVKNNQNVWGFFQSCASDKTQCVSPAIKQF